MCLDDFDRSARSPARTVARSRSLTERM